MSKITSKKIFIIIIALLVFGIFFIKIEAEHKKSYLESSLKYVPLRYKKAVRQALDSAGDNAVQMARALHATHPLEVSKMSFVIANMPTRDLKTLRYDFLLENLQWARWALSQVSWKGIPQEIFFNYVVPYASLNERRDNWRKDFCQRFIGIAKESRTIREAAQKLNSIAFKELNVAYDAQKRPKPDQSPHESMEASYASCTGLSILLVDVLRSVAIPARIVLIPEWVDGSGNHTWVEVWENQKWYYIGAAEPGEFNETWFTEKASQTDSTDPEHRIYAASFKKTGLSMPMVWEKSIDDIWAIDVTSRYLKSEER